MPQTEPNFGLPNRFMPIQDDLHTETLDTNMQYEMDDNKRNTERQTEIEVESETVNELTTIVEDPENTYNIENSFIGQTDNSDISDNASTSDNSANESENQFYASPLSNFMDFKMTLNTSRAPHSRCTNWQKGWNVLPC